MKRILSISAISLSMASTCFAGEPIKIVAAENFYGDIAKQIGGDRVAVTSILSNPDQDPHLFEASPSVARDISGAAIVIANGLDYDPWINTLLDASPSQARKLISVGELAGKRPGDNPHLWYDPQNVLRMAQTLTKDLAAADPAGKADYEKRLETFKASLSPIETQIATLKARFGGTPVAATEPVFGYMFDAMGMEVLEGSFQTSVMNDTEPSASDTVAFENDLKTHKIKLLVYNSQATDPVADRMKALAGAAGIPIVGATETQPPGISYQDWMLAELADVSKAFSLSTQ
ncbi:metal ABC transporter solute-binding protein, Zn/Mn family [Aestuariivirga sp.]|uniref:metal ABC transporter solute-binding protein, Zn/Mn family n=1 Tax=Aestuariivirga sp. TaxID=2650926 RepID=UPI0039E23EDD